MVRQKKVKTQAPIATVSTIVPPWVSNPILRRSFRFNCTSANLTSISVGGVRAILSAATATNTTFVKLIQAFKVERVRIIDTAGSNVFLEWTAKNGPNKNTESIGNSTFPSKIDQRPPSNSNCAFWQTSITDADGIFTLRGASSTTFVDVWLAIVLDSGSGTTGTAQASFGAAGVYYGPLDGPQASPVFPSESLDTFK
jgi:hypothetical protein